MNELSISDNTYQAEKSETLALADATMNGKTVGFVQGTVGTWVDGFIALGKLVTNVSGSAFGDAQSAQDLHDGAGVTWDFVKDPNNWPQLIGAMSSTDREKLATAYERGDGKAVGQILGAQFANMPLPSGGVAGTISKVDKASIVAADVAKADSTLADAAKLANITAASPMDMAHTIGTSDGRVIEPIVTAKGTVNGIAFEDFNQTAKIGATNEPTLIADRVTAKSVATGKQFPNGTVVDSHAEIGVIQQAYNAGKTQGSEMSITVSGKDVCGYCKGDIAAAADVAGLKSLTVKAVDETGVSKTYYWKPGMKSIKENP